MITLFTGAPRSGKTAALVDLLVELSKTRAIYSDGLDGLRIPHQAYDPATWHEEVPDGAVCVVDEAQRVWRARPVSQRVPDAVVQLETHGHNGIDFYLTTQMPKLLDTNVRALVGRHVHIRNLGVLGRWWYEWPEVCENPLADWRRAPIKRRYKLPKRAFKLYRSATEHSKPTRSFPWMLAVAVGALIGVGVLAWVSWQRISERVQGASDAVVPAVAPVLPQSAPVSGSVPSYSAAGPVDDRTAWVPRTSSRPESAPAFDHLRQVVAMPVVAGGVCSASRCRCYTQQGTDAGLTDDECRKWLASPPFDPYKLPMSSPVAQPAAMDQPSQDPAEPMPVEPGMRLPASLAPSIGNRAHL